MLEGPHADEREAVLATARRAREAAVALRRLTRMQKDAALRAMADALRDVDAGDPRGERPRRRARRSRWHGCRNRRPADPDRGPAGRHRRRPARRSPSCPTRSARSSAATRCPTASRSGRSGCRSASSAMIYEARPNVTVDAAGLCLKSGNAALLRGSSSAYDVQPALVAVMRDALVGPGRPGTRSSWSPAARHESVKRPDDRPRPGRRADPARRCRADPQRRRGARPCR